MFRKEIILAIFLLTITTAPVMLAQSIKASISGTVSDETGGVIPGAEVTVTNLDLGVSRTVISNDLGRYLASELELGTFEVKGTLTGFQTAVRTGISLTVGRNAVVNLTMTVGSISEVVTVTGEASLVETTSMTISGLVDTQQIADLPGRRDMLRFALLEGGVKQSVMASGNVGSPSILSGYGIAMSIAGARNQHNNFLLDGARVNTVQNGGPAGIANIQLGADSIREMKVMTTNYSAEYGNAAGGVVSWVTKSGTNQFHGSIFEYHRNKSLNANTFMNNKVGADKDPFIFNQYGASVGGPIIKDNSFFFFNYEGITQRAALTGIANTITPEAKMGILPKGAFGGTCNDPAYPEDPATGKCVGTVASSVLPYLDLWDLPNGIDNDDGTAQILIPGGSPIDQNYYVAKVDHNFNESHAIFVRATHDRGSTTVGNNGRYQQSLSTGADNWTIEERSVFSPNFVNSIRYSLARSTVAQEDELTGTAVDPSLYFIPWMGTMGQFWIGGSGTLGSAVISPTPSDGSPRKQTQNLFHFSNDASYIRGNHTFKFGIENRRLQNNMQFVSSWGGRYRFSDLADFLQGIPSQSRGSEEFQANGSNTDYGRGWRMTYWGFYINDSIQVRPNLTLNLGLRYEPHTVPTEVNDKLSNVRDPFRDTTYTFGEPFFENPSLSNWAPRIGLAWDPTGEGKTSVRAGIGYYYHLLDIGGSFLQGTISMPPSVGFTLSPSNSPGGVVPFPHPLDIQGGIPSGSQASFGIPFKDIQTPLMYRWNLDVQREVATGTVVSLGYVGSHGIRLWASRQVNSCPTQFGDGRRYTQSGCEWARNPNFATNQMQDNPSSSKYHGLIAKVNRRFSQSFSFNASYTWSKSIDDDQGSRGGQSSGSVLIWGGSIDDIKAGRGLSDFHVSQNLVVNGSWALPGPVGGVAGAIVGGWQVNAILTVSDGPPFTAGLDRSWGYQGPQTDNYAASLLPGRDNNASNPGDVDNYIDKTAFTLPASSNPADQAKPQGSPALNVAGCGNGSPECRAYGDLGRNTVMGPGVNTFDFGLMKNWAIPQFGEQGSFQFRAEFLNAFNRANFGRPSSLNIFGRTGNISSSAGRITKHTTSARNIQLALRIFF